MPDRLDSGTSLREKLEGLSQPPRPFLPGWSGRVAAVVHEGAGSKATLLLLPGCPPVSLTSGGWSLTPERADILRTAVAREVGADEGSGSPAVGSIHLPAEGGEEGAIRTREWHFLAAHTPEVGIGALLLAGVQGEESGDPSGGCYKRTLEEIGDLFETLLHSRAGAGSWIERLVIGMHELPDGVALLDERGVEVHRNGRLEDMVRKDAELGEAFDDFTRSSDPGRGSNGILDLPMTSFLGPVTGTRLLRTRAGRYALTCAEGKGECREAGIAFTALVTPLGDLESSDQAGP